MVLEQLAVDSFLESTAVLYYLGNFPDVFFDLLLSLDPLFLGIFLMHGPIDY